MSNLIGQIGRRRLLSLGVVAGAGVIAGCSPDGGLLQSPEGTYCVPRAELVSQRTLGTAALVYDISEKAQSFSFETGFASQLEAWLSFFVDQSGLTTPDQLWTFGSWIDGGSDCDSWHHSGRAFDLSRLRSGPELLVSCRYDLWQGYPAAQLEFHRRQYWAVAASLHHQFASVLTYLYNSQHHNHIHIDNGISGAELPIFRSRSQPQVQAVQAICSYLWATPTEITGEWDPATRRSAGLILDQIGHGGDLDDSPEHWRAFLAASARRGAG